jgi:hypothetical protein
VSVSVEVIFYRGNHYYRLGCCERTLEAKKHVEIIFYRGNYRGIYYLTFWGAVRALMRPKTRVNIGSYYLQRKLLFTEETIITFWGAVSALMSSKNKCAYTQTGGM